MGQLKRFQPLPGRRRTHIPTRTDRVAFVSTKVQYRAIAVAILMLVLMFALPHSTGTLAAAAGQTAMDVSFDQPQVATDSYVDSGDAQYVSFPGAPGERCNTDTPGVTVTENSTQPSCVMSQDPNFGPTQPAFWGPANTSYPAVYNAVGISVRFDTPQAYLGIWWTAGSYGNRLEFYSGDTLVAATTADDMFTLMNDGNHADYFGNPSSLDEQGNRLDGGEPFVYMHYFASAGVTFDRVVMLTTGNGFEFANLSVSESHLTPNANLTYLQSFSGPTLQVVYNANGGTGYIGPSTDESAVALRDVCNWLGGNAYQCFDPPYGGNFKGWNSAPDGTGTWYNPGDVITTPGDPLVVTLYAQWAATWYVYNDWANDIGWADWVTSFEQHYGDDLTLPDPASYGLYPPAGKEFDGWYSMTHDWVPIRIGGAGDVLNSTTYAPYLYSQALYARWKDSTVVSPAPTVLGFSSGARVVPIDPRVTTFTLPSLPIVNSASAHVCVAEVTDATGATLVDGSAILVSSSVFDFSENITGIELQSSAPIAHTASKYIRILVADPADTTCSGGNTYVFELRPLGLNGQRSVIVNVG